jgi:hypothetical protein
MRAIECVNTGTVAAHCNNDRAVSVEDDCSFAIALSGAGRDRFSRRFACQRCRTSMRGQGVGP